MSPRDKDAEFWAKIARQTLRVFFDSAPGGAQALYETLCRSRDRVASRYTPEAGQAERLEYLIALVEASGAYAPEESRYRALYEQTRPKD